MNGFKYGETNPVQSAAVGTASVIAIGDMVSAKTGDAWAPKAAGDYVWDTNLATTQGEFHTDFLGVSLARSRTGDTASINVATTGVFEFDCASTSFELGAIVGPAKQAGNLLEPQKVVTVATVALSIGRVIKRTTASTKVWVAITSTIMWGGPQA